MLTFLYYLHKYFTCHILPKELNESSGLTVLDVKKIKWKQNKILHLSCFKLAKKSILELLTFGEMHKCRIIYQKSVKNFIYAKL